MNPAEAEFEMNFTDQPLATSMSEQQAQTANESGESDSRRSSTKRRMMDLRLRQQYSVEMAAATSAAVPPPPSITLQQQQSLPFNRISRQRMKRLSRESIGRNVGGQSASLEEPVMPAVVVPGAASPLALDSTNPPSIVMPLAQRSSGSSLRHSLLGHVMRKTSTESASKIQGPTISNVPSTSSLSHGGSVKQPKKVAFAKSELDDFDAQLFKPHEFDDVFSDLKFES